MYWLNRWWAADSHTLALKSIERGRRLLNSVLKHLFDTRARRMHTLVARLMLESKDEEGSVRRLLILSLRLLWRLRRGSLADSR